MGFYQAPTCRMALSNATAYSALSMVHMQSPSLSEASTNTMDLLHNPQSGQKP